MYFAAKLHKILHISAIAARIFGCIFGRIFGVFGRIDKNRDTVAVSLFPGGSRKPRVLCVP